MFVELYRHKIKSVDFDKWKKNNDAAWKMYSEFWEADYKRLFKKLGDLIEVMELGFYKSREDYQDLIAKLESNKQLGLFNLFKAL